MKILFLAANPSDTAQLRLAEESRSIDQAMRQAEYRDRFELAQAHAVRVADLQGLLLRYQPHIVHFSGHGSTAQEIPSGSASRHWVALNSSGQAEAGGAIILEDNNGHSHPVSARALSTVFSLLKDNIRCVVLNACYSEVQAQAIAQHIDCVIGMSVAISDRAAISFATAFYQALGFGKDIKTAFELGRAQIDLENIPEEQTPRLLAVNVDPAKIVLVSQSDQRSIQRTSPEYEKLTTANLSTSRLVPQHQDTSLSQEGATLQTITIPILLKAVDFLFGEGSEILQERRERRSIGHDVTLDKPQTLLATDEEMAGSLAIETREDALSHPIVEATWSVSEAKIKHLLRLMEIHIRNYYLAKEQYAKWGSALVPPIIASNLTEAENEIAKTAQDLQTELGKVYGMKVAVPEVQQL